MDENTDFKSFLKAKKIDPVLFKEAESALYSEWEGLFEQVSPESFSAQKLFLINPIRRKYHLEDKEKEEVSKPKMAARPKFKRP